MFDFLPFSAANKLAFPELNCSSFSVDEARGFVLALGTIPAVYPSLPLLGLLPIITYVISFPNGNVKLKTD